MSLAQGSELRVTDYPLLDADGRHVATHVREDTPKGKLVRWRLPDGTWGLNGTRISDLPLYGAEKLSSLDADALVVVVEGEKARDALEAAGLSAVGTVTGAAGTPGAGALEVLQDRRVCLWPDADDPGHGHMARIADGLRGTATEVLLYTWDEAPEKGDAADHPAVLSRDAVAVDRLLTDLEGSPRWASDSNGGSRGADTVGLLLSEVVAEQVSWLWEKRVPLGKLTIVEGDPGLGKTALLVDAAARVSVGGEWPDGSPCKAGGVVILTAEDGLADTIRPRLDAAGGDPSKVLALATVSDGDAERLISIPEDLPIVRRGIDRVGARLVIVDPIMAFLSGNVNSHRDQDVRRALAPLARLAESTGVSAVAVRHLTKSAGDNALYRGGGSIGILGASRSTLLVAKHPEEEYLRVVATLKSNLAAPTPSLAFSLTESDNGAVRVEWKGQTPHTAEALLVPPPDPEERSALDEAKDFLRDALKGGSRWSNAVKKEAREVDISEMTLKRAKAALQVRSIKNADGSWTWRLPEGKGIEGGQTPQCDPLEPFEPLPAKGSLRADQKDQGDEGAQEDQVRGDERLSFTDDGFRPQRRCIHDVPGGCWLCNKSSSEGGD